MLIIQIGGAVTNRLGTIVVLRRLLRKSRPCWEVIFLLFAGSMLASCGGGSSNPSNTADSNPSSTIPSNTGGPYYASTLAASIVDSPTPEVAMDATAQALSAGGIGLGADSPAQYPPASWEEDSRLAFNMMMEERDRATSGRFTLEQVGQMLTDFGFPFAGSGTPGEQLMAFLRTALEEAKVNENAPGSFMPLFIAEMAQRQVPPVDISDPAAKPEDLRVTLLEIELLIAAFDRAYQDTAVSALTGISPRALDVGACDVVKKYLGTVGDKAAKAGVKHVAGQLSNAALAKMGLKSGEIEVLKGTMGKVFTALDAMMKVAKLLQVYSTSHVTLTVQGDDPIYKPEKGGARVLEPVKAIAGVPDEAFQNYEKSMGGQAYQNLKSCLAAAGMPLPSDLMDSLKDVDKWRVTWALNPGSEKHTELKTDVNTFDGSFSGNPFTMKLVSSGVASATATLKVDIKEEPELATFFQGPYVSKKITVKAETQTAEPPSPAILAGVTSLIGTLSSLLDLTVGWVQTGLPPATTTTFTVKYHPMPDSINATATIDMRYVYTYFSTEPPVFEHTAKGEWNALLDYAGTDPETDDGYAGYRGTGQMAYHSATTKKYPQAGDDCTYSYAVTTIDGQATGVVFPPSNQSGGALAGDPPFQFAIGINNASAAPMEQETQTMKCPNAYDVVTTLPPMPKIMLGALQAMNMVDDKILLEGGKVPGLSLSSNWILQADGSLQRTLAGAQNIIVQLNDGTQAHTDILSQNTVLKLKPIFATNVTP